MMLIKKMEHEFFKKELSNIRAKHKEQEYAKGEVKMNLIKKIKLASFERSLAKCRAKREAQEYARRYYNGK